MFVALVRACVLSGLGVSLRTSSYAMPIPLITTTALLQTYERKTGKNSSTLTRTEMTVILEHIIIRIIPLIDINSWTSQVTRGRAVVQYFLFFLNRDFLVE